MCSRMQKEVRQELWAEDLLLVGKDESGEAFKEVDLEECKARHEATGVVSRGEDMVLRFTSTDNVDNVDIGMVAIDVAQREQELKLV